MAQQQPDHYLQLDVERVDGRTVARLIMTMPSGRLRVSAPLTRGDLLHMLKRVSVALDAFDHDQPRRAVN